MELLGHMVVLFLMFWTTSILPCTVAVPGYHPTRSAWGFPFLFLMFLPTLVIYYYFFFDNSLKECKSVPFPWTFHTEHKDTKTTLKRLKSGSWVSHCTAVCSINPTHPVQLWVSRSDLDAVFLCSPFFQPVWCIYIP